MIPVYILIRTSNRPKCFKTLMESIESQTYPYIKTIVHTDDPKDTYAKGDIIVKGKRSKKGNAPYNLYNNTLLQNILDGPGWYVFIDDDDAYTASDVIEKFVKNAKEDYINVAKADRGHGRIWPKHWKKQTSFQTECFMLHTKHKNLAKWWNKKGGDHHYTSQITKVLPINWIEDLIVCKAQIGKGRGLRKDK
jgi:glycosyltransferase involved in cell wall biosynthesis